MMHRIIARALRRDPSLLARGWTALERQKSRGEDSFRIQEWAEILSLPIPELARKIIERSENMERLRLSSPLYFVVDFTDLDLRRRLIAKAKRGIVYERRAIFVEELSDEDLRLIAKARVPEDLDWDPEADQS
ncbi:MAG: hypothetical protein CMI59_05195 [Parvibaculum sp.]|nr:hypothetical protein [Parvibaculum sp.]